MENITELQAEARRVRRAVNAFGGGFMTALGQAMAHADSENLAKIKRTWPDEWAQYLAMEARMK
jgi:hypothetical protein